MSRHRTIGIGIFAAAALAACTAAPAPAPPTGAASASRTEIPIPAQDGPGVTDTEIRLAVDQLFPFNTPAYQAVVRALNAAGGIAGRKVTLVPLASLEAESNQPPDVIDRATCLKLKDDRQGFLGVLNDGRSAAFHECLGAANMLTVLSSSSAIDPRILQLSPFTAGPGITDTRLARAYADQLVASGFVSAGQKVVVLTTGGGIQTGVEQAVKEVLIPALTDAGIDSVQVVTQPEIGSGDGPAIPTNSAVKIKSLAPDRLVVYGSGLGLSATVAAAVGQSVTAPVAGLSTMTTTGDSDAEGFGLTAAGKEQKAGSRFLTWNASRSRSVDVQLLSGKQVSQVPATVAACAKTIAAAKLDSTQLLFGQIACEQLDVLRDALKASGSAAINAPAFIAGLGRLGKRDSNTTLAVDYGQQHRDAISATEWRTYVADCDCYEPSGEPRAIPGAGR